MKTTLTKNELRVRNLTMMATFDVIEEHFKKTGTLPSLTAMATLVQNKLDNDYAEARHIIELDQFIMSSGLAIIALCEKRAKKKHGME